MAIASDNLDLHRAKSVDRHDHHIAALDRADTGRRSRHDDVARCQFEVFGQIGNHFGDLPDHLVQVAFLPQGAIDRKRDATVVKMPDGRTLAYRAQRTDGYESDRWQIVLRDLDASDALTVGPARWLTSAWDRGVGSAVWAADGASLYAIADHLGSVGLFEVSTAGEVTALQTVLAE